MKQFIILSLLLSLLLSCNKRQKATNIVDSIKTINRDSLSIQKLVPPENIYHGHFITDLDNDSIHELILLSKTTDSSECLSFEYDLNCVNMDINIFLEKQDNWIPLSNYSLPDFESRVVKLDTNNYFEIKSFVKYTGHSKGELREKFKLRGDSLMLSKINYWVKTKLYSGYGTSFDEWNYKISFNKDTSFVKWTKARLLHDSLNFKDTLIPIQLETKGIPLGTYHSLKDIIGDKNLYHHY